MARLSWNWSIERKLPLTFTGLLAIVIAGFTWAAYREVRRSAVSAASERLQRVTSQLVDLLGTSAKQLVTNGQQIAERPAIRSYLRGPLGGRQAEALAALQPVPVQTQMVVEMEVWDASGSRVLATRPDLPPLEREAAQTLIRSLPSAAPAAIGTIRRLGRGDTLVFPLVARVTDGEQLLGYVVQLRRIAASPQGGRQLAQLIGSEAALYFGNADGDLWTDFATVVPGPPVPVRDTHGIIEYRRESGATYMAAPARIPTTPWTVLVEFPSAPVLAPARAFALRMGTVGLILLAAGTLAGWASSRRMLGLQHRVRSSEARLRSVTDTAHDAIVAADGAGRIAFWNPGAARIFGYSADEVIGRPLTMLMPERYHAAHLAGLERYAQTGVPNVVGRSVELEGRRKDGSEFPLELSLAAACADGRVSFTGVIRDITERKHIERALHETNAELEAFAYSVSHDLRAPLRAIHGFGRILLEDHGTRLDPEARRLVDVIGDSTRKMGQLIDDLLAFSRLSRRSMEKAPVDLTELARGVGEEIRRAEGDRALEITVAPLPTARGDRQMLRQALANLLQNAAKFTRRRPDARIDVGHRTEQGEVVYYVRDNGAGFDPRYRDKLFGVFQRLHANEEFEGTGVGLAIVQRIVHRHGGRVWAEGQVDAGATFFFTLPGVPDA